MRRVVFHFDVISPYAYLAFERLPEALADISHHLVYQPVLFAGLLRAWGYKGPVEIPAKREWTWRQVGWLSNELAVPLQAPGNHPFNPLALLRLALACGPVGSMPNRRVVEIVMHHVWQGGGADPTDAGRIARLRSALKPVRDPDGVAVKAELKALTDAAIHRGLFGVPTFEVGGRLYWGLDALPMLRADLLASADEIRGT